MRLHSFVLETGEVLVLPEGAPHVVIDVGPKNFGADPDDVGGVRARAMELEYRVRLARDGLEERMRQRALPVELVDVPGLGTFQCRKSPAPQSEPVDVPITRDFWAGVRREVEYQRQKWGTTSDEGKTHADWFWLVGHLAGKALHAAIAGNIDKALHHTISSAAALANWHAAITGEHTAMRPGIEPPEGERA